jgi:hypothetical protein
VFYVLSGAFKFRGACNAVLSLTEKDASKGVIIPLAETAVIVGVFWVSLVPIPLYYFVSSLYYIYICHKKTMFAFTVSLFS